MRRDGAIPPAIYHRRHNQYSSPILRAATPVLACCQRPSSTGYGWSDPRDYSAMRYWSPGRPNGWTTSTRWYVASWLGTTVRPPMASGSLLCLEGRCDGRTAGRDRMAGHASNSFAAKRRARRRLHEVRYAIRHVSHFARVDPPPPRAYRRPPNLR